MPGEDGANTVVPSAAAFVLRDGAVLLTERSDNGDWSMPGGAQDPGESLTVTAIGRQPKKRASPFGRLDSSVFTDQKHAVRYTNNDEVRQEISVVDRADYVASNPTTSSATTQVEGVPAEKV